MDEEDQMLDEEEQAFNNQVRSTRRSRDLNKMIIRGKKLLKAISDPTAQENMTTTTYGITPDENQKQIINSPKENNLVVSSGPGSGKTTTLTLRIIKYMIEKVEPKTILCITFTNRGRNEFESKFQKFINEGNEILEHLSPRFMTFHSYASEFLLKKKNRQLSADRYSQLKKIKFIEQTEVEKTLKKIKKDFFLVYSVSEIKRMLLESRFFISQNENGDVKTKFSIAHYQVYSAYKKFLDDKNANENRKYYDFTELLIELNDDLMNSLFDDDIQYLFVDEAQDTNQLMFSIIEKMIPYLKSVTCVGDSWQKIFSYSGIDLNDFVESFSSLSDSTVHMELPTNYRSSPSIQIAHKAIRDGNPVRRVPEDFEYRIFNWSTPTNFSVTNQFLIMNSLVPKFLEKGKSIFILFRRNHEMKQFQTFCTKNGYEWIRNEQVTVEVCHKVKGGESDIVFICGVVEMNIPCYQEIDANPRNNPFNEVIDVKINRERRLFYVSISRPRDLLILFSPTNVKDCISFLHWSVKTTVQSEFIQELGACVASVNGIKHFLTFKRTYC